jgi:hypothetical protein
MGSGEILFGESRQGRKIPFRGFGTGEWRQIAGIRIKRREVGLVCSGKRRQITGT